MSLNNDDFDKYFSIYETARKYEKENNIEGALELYLSILKNYIPIGSAYYDRPAIILEKLKNYDQAVTICELAIKNQMEHNLHFDKESFEHRKRRLLEKSNKPAIETKSKPKKRKDSTAVANIKTAPIQKDIVFPDWYVSISFGASKSPNYPQALTIAKMAPQYIENVIEGNVLHQAVYSENPKEYLKFIKLYELVSQWKSCYVVINGELIDRKIVSGLNYCYGDKCRSGKSDFCFGASLMTANPFGCHRLQISSYNNPWWTFGYLDIYNVWHIDKEAILKRIEEYSLPYEMCPCFSKERINSVVHSLPQIISPSNDKNWTFSYNGIQPADFYNISSAVNFSFIENSMVAVTKETPDLPCNNENEVILDTKSENSIGDSIHQPSKSSGIISSLFSIFKK